MKAMGKFWGLPLIAWIAIALVGASAVAYVVVTVWSATTIAEPISVVEELELPATMWPGESKVYKIDITNAAGAPTYTMRYTITFSGPTGASYTATLEGAPYVSGAAASLAGGATHDLDITVTIAPDGAPGPVSVSVSVDRA